MYNKPAPEAGLLFVWFSRIVDDDVFSGGLRHFEWLLTFIANAN